jgi:PiT family inorganic phosphate transporter
MVFIFLSSGLFLGWSLGANDAANVFGTAVGTRMIRFRVAAVIASLFVIVGAVVQGTGTTNTLGALGSVNALAGSFTLALTAALTVFLMTKYAIPVSTSQAIVGAIIGWNLYSGNPTDYRTLTDIVITWILCPVMAGIFAVLLYLLLKVLIRRIRIHLMRLDMFIRFGLIIAGAFGAYALGANNIANVMGVYVDAWPFGDVTIIGGIVVTSTQQLFFIGGLAISTGILTYSKKIMKTVGGELLKMNSEAAIIVVLAQALVLFVFSSMMLREGLLSLGLPALPLVPVSSSQAVVGAILGIGILKGARGIRYGILGQIAAGWVATPLITAIITYLALFFVENVFQLAVSST